MNKYAVGLYDNEQVLKTGIKKLFSAGVEIYDVYTPHPVHGIEEMFSIPRSRLPVAAFCFGCLGLSLAFLMMWYMMHYDWPMNIGGKPTLPAIAFIPVSFECTVLLAAHGMGLTFLVVTRLIPGSTPRIMDERATDDRYVIAVKINGQDAGQVGTLLQDSGAVEVKVKEANY